MQKPSPQSLEISRQGAFPKQIDPWAEQATYFHQLHGHLITYLLDQIADALYERAYLVGRERSIQISSSYPDVSIREAQPHPPSSRKYAEFAASLELEAGTPILEPEIDRLFIKSIETGDLVTVLELVSPSNKSSIHEIEAYQVRRSKLIHDGVNVVEIDLSRSVKRLFEKEIVKTTPYHIVIYPYNDVPYFLGMALNEPLKTFALPLRDEAIPLSLEPAYRQAYQKLHIAAQIQRDTGYELAHLPFPSLLTEAEKETLLAAVKAWQAAMQTSEEN